MNIHAIAHPTVETGKGASLDREKWAAAKSLEKAFLAEMLKSADVLTGFSSEHGSAEIFEHAVLEEIATEMVQRRDVLATSIYHSLIGDE